MSLFFSRKLIVIFCGLLLCVGCHDTPHLEGLVPAKGIVTFNDKPIEGVSIFFRPLGQGQAASATSDSNGRFTLMTFNPDDGIRPGEYVVTATKTITNGEILVERPPGTNQKIIHDNREIVDYLPEKYASPSLTDIKIRIPDDGKTDIEITLTGEVDVTPKKVNEMKHRT